MGTYQKVTLKKMEKSSNKSPVTMEKPDDLTLEQCQEVENIEDFKRLCEINCKGDEEIKDMVELRRKIKNRVSFSGREEILGIWEFGNPEISHLFKPNLTYPNLT